MAQANSVSALVNSLGVKTFLEVPVSSYNAYSALPFATINSDIAYLGIHLIRESAYNVQTASATLVAEFNALISQGYKFDMGAGASTTNMANLDQFVTLHPGALQSVEGPNEINYFPFAYNGQTGEAAATAFQSDAYRAVKQDPLLAGVQVLDFTGGGRLLGDGQTYQTLPANADLANVHLYPANGDPPSWYVSAIFNAQYGKPITAPFAVTEAGYNSDPYATNGVSLNVQAKQTLSLVLDAAQSGASSIYLYELLDHYADPANTNADNHWGLFNSDGSPKPVATALHNLTTILADPGTTTANMVPLGTVSYSSPNMPWGTHNWLLEKSSGVFDLLLWQEPKIWDPLTKTEIPVASTPVTIDLGTTYQSIKLFDPLSGNNAIASYTNARTVTVPISDHAVILEFSSSPISPAGTLQPVILQPLISTVTGNRDGGVTLTGSSSRNTTVTVSDIVGGKTTMVGTATTSSTGAWSLTSHAMVNMAMINSFTVSTLDNTGNMVSMAGKFLLASTGIDTMNGTAGVSDVFAVMSFKGSEIIHGFETAATRPGAAHDVIDFSGRGISSFNQLQPLISGGATATITIAAGKTITLSDVAASTLTALDFRYS